MDSCISFVVTSEKMLSSFDMTNIVVVDNQILVRGTCTIDSRIYLCPPWFIGVPWGAGMRFCTAAMILQLIMAPMSAVDPWLPTICCWCAMDPDCWCCPNVEIKHATIQSWKFSLSPTITASGVSSTRLFLSFVWSYLTHTNRQNDPHVGLL